MSHTSRTCASIGWCWPGWSSKPPKSLSSMWFLPVSNFEEIFLLLSSYLQTSTHKSMSLCLNPSIFMNQTVEPGANDWLSLSTHFLSITKIYLLFKVLWILNYIIHCLITVYWRSNSHDFSSFLSTAVAPISNHTRLFCFQPFSPPWHPGNWSFLHSDYFILHSSPMNVRFCDCLGVINGCPLSLLPSSST